MSKDGSLSPDDRNDAQKALARLQHSLRPLEEAPKIEDISKASSEELLSSLEIACNTFNDAYRPLVFVKFLTNDYKQIREFGPYARASITNGPTGGLSLVVDNGAEAEEGEDEIHIAAWIDGGWILNDGLSGDSTEFAIVRFFNKTPADHMADVKRKLVK